MYTKYQNKRKSSDWAVNAFFIAFILFLIVGIAWLTKSFPGFEYGNGIRTGVNYKLSKKGYIYKTWEGELSLQLRAPNSDGVSVNQVFNYSVSDEKVAEKIDIASQSGKVVTLVYKQYAFRGWGLGGSSYDVIDVKQAQ